MSSLSGNWVERGHAKRQQTLDKFTQHVYLNGAFQSAPRAVSADVLRPFLPDTDPRNCKSAYCLQRYLSLPPLFGPKQDGTISGLGSSSAAPISTLPTLATTELSIPAKLSRVADNSRPKSNLARSEAPKSVDESSNPCKLPPLRKNVSRVDEVHELQQPVEKHISSENLRSGRSETSPAVREATLNSCPPYGCKGSCGQRSNMQDSHTVVRNFMHFHAPEGLVGHEEWPIPLCSGNRETVPIQTGKCSPADSTETFHFFAVYDGHGGSAASQLCSKRLHSQLLGALGGSDCYEYLRRSPNGQEQEAGEGVELLGDAPEAKAGNFVQAQPVTANRMAGALLKAFQGTDLEVSSAQQEKGSSDYAGSTAVVALVSQSMIWIANCGDSRAVLMRGGEAVPLSSDQTASREDEAARIVSRGGEIYYLQDCARVMGVLAMSRSIGDSYLHPYVIPDPEHTALPRRPDDELLILGTDGLWDKLSNEEACSVAKRCLERARAKGASARAAARCAATVLVRTAASKGSRDNITAVVVDLRGSDGQP
uniref:protein-serine/threonine phosphatase n=1 Tax=Tetraselmis sp. GSL018 TaxID=582737 RepID=A0A061RT10_9CHLO